MIKKMIILILLILCINSMIYDDVTMVPLKRKVYFEFLNNGAIDTY